MSELAKAIKILKRMNACAGPGDAIPWLESLPSDTPVQTAWDTCERGDWMLWLIGRTTKSEPWSEERKPLVRVALECARLTWKSMLPAGRECVDLHERWCAGEDIPRDRLERARRAAYAYAAYADAYAAYAAYADAYAAYAAAADAYAAAAAAVAAAYAAADADAATREQTLAKCAAIVRKHFPVCPLELT